MRNNLPRFLVAKYYQKRIMEGTIPTYQGGIMADTPTPDQLAAPFRPPVIYELSKALQMGCGKPIWHTGTCTRYHMCHRCQAIKRQLPYFCLL